MKILLKTVLALSITIAATASALAFPPLPPGPTAENSVTILNQTNNTFDVSVKANHDATVEQSYSKINAHSAPAFIMKYYAFYEKNPSMTITINGACTVVLEKDGEHVKLNQAGSSTCQVNGSNSVLILQNKYSI